MEKIDLHGKRIVVTGGSMGIGKAAVRICADAGAKVVFCARGQLAINETLAQLESEGIGADRVAGVRADVSQQIDVRSLFDEAQSRMDGPVDGVIHAAAVLGAIGPVLDVEPEAWLDTLRVNLFGTFLVVREACAHMTTSGGRIAVFSGGGASGPFPNYTAYACSKVGVVRFVETVAQEVAVHGIEINCVAPGFVATRMHQETINAGSRLAGETYLQRTKQELQEGGTSPEVGARAAAFLVSDAARGITGKFVAAVHDDWQQWPDHLAELRGSDIFTLRRVLPKERGLAWQ